jgi:hypothetical protein
MRFLAISLLSAVTIFLFASNSFSQAKQYVAVSKPFVNVYKELDPKSMVVGQARKGDYLEIVAIGDLWYKAKMDKTEGWLEKRAGEVVDKPGNSSTEAIIVILLFVAAAFGIVSFYIYKSKLSGSASE